MAEIERAAVRPRYAARRTARARVPKLFAPLGALALTVAVVGAAAFALTFRGGAADPTSAAAAVLQRAARVAEAGGGPRPLRPGEFWYVKSEWTTAGAAVPDPSRRGGIVVIVDALTTIERQVWIGVDRPGLIVTEAVGPITFLSSAARQQWIREGRPRQIALPGRVSLPPDSFIRPYRQLLTLPTNVDELWRMLYRDAGTGGPVWKRHEIFTEIGDLLREDPIPAKVRAALYLVAARIPGIELLGLTHDGIGRPALAVALNDTFDGTRDELLFDPRTSALLGEASVVVKPPSAYRVKPDTVRTGSTYITSGIVDRLGALPTGLNG